MIQSSHFFHIKIYIAGQLYRGLLRTGRIDLGCLSTMITILSGFLDICLSAFSFLYYKVYRYLKGRGLLILKIIINYLRKFQYV